MITRFIRHVPQMLGPIRIMVGLLPVPGNKI
jgi:hypothetical protein